ncbi:MAG: hypothetical protein E7170_05075 [Firmicutes bacterium]|nr:hypothetical protein [Bacillota bacterium]
MEKNYIRFPYNIYEPEEIIIDDIRYILYLARFNNLYELYEYLNSKPMLNRRVFHEFHSITDKEDFAGKPYNEALEDLIKDIDPGYEEFLKLQKDINCANNMYINRYKTVMTVAGGHMNTQAYSTGQPLCYETQERVMKSKFLRMHIMLGYRWDTTKSQVLNRAIIITNILKALEDSGYNVDINAFKLTQKSNEISHTIIKLKKYGEKIDMQALYKTLCNVEFLRRILFRVLETLDVKRNWEEGYGSTCSKEFASKVLKLNNDDIYFDQPNYMDIYGYDLASDFENAINHLSLQDKIDVEKAKYQFENSAKILNLKK